MVFVDDRDEELIQKADEDADWDAGGQMSSQQPAGKEGAGVPQKKRPEVSLNKRLRLATVDNFQVRTPSLD